MISQYCLQHQEVNVLLHKDGLTSRGDSVMSILSLELTKGSSVTIEVDLDHEEVLEHIVGILNGQIV